MSIWQRAYETYENHKDLAGKEAEGKPTLTPINHMVQKAQIEITLSADGDFVSAVSVDKNNAKTIIPATEESGSRSGSSVRPHPLCDQMKFLVPDSGEPYEKYVEQLRAWANSKYTSPKLNAVLTYIENGEIIDNLFSEGVISSDDETVYSKTKIQNTEFYKCMVRWNVIGADEPSECWRDLNLFTAFQNYQNSLLDEAKKQLCYLSGKKEVPAQSHPKGTVQASFGAKLISANDKTNFTYRGRFVTPEQAMTLGNTSSQKLHSALQWVIAKDGVTYGERTFVCWNPKGKEVVSTYNPLQTDEENPTNDPSEYRKRLRETLDGFRKNLPDEEDVVIAAFSAATTGRLSVTLYSEMKASDFHDRVESWYDSICFPKWFYGITTPTIAQIARCAFFPERNGMLDVGRGGSSDSKFFGEQCQRLLRCIVDSAPIPQDIVNAIADKANQPLKYDKCRNLVLFTACAVIRKYLNDKANKEEWTMVLDTNNHDRSYLFGRLLAVMEHIEWITYRRGEERQTNAIRAQTVFSKRPFYATRVIEEKLIHYYKKLHPATVKKYKDLVGEILALLSDEDASRLNMPLDDTYLLGYYFQRNALRNEKEQSTENENTEENNNVNA